MGRRRLADKFFEYYREEAPDELIWLILCDFKKIKPSRFIIAGFLAPLLLTLTYLIYHQLIPSFLDLFLNFNATYYSRLAGKLPNPRQLLLAGLITAPTFISLVKNKKYLPILMILLSLLPAWPRFELIHLLPAITLAVYFYATSSKDRRLLFPRLLLTLFLIWSAKKILTVNYGNFYLNQDTQKVSSYLRDQSQNQVFVLGGSDLIYPLSGKTPAGDYYLPSLPWYYANPNFIHKQLDALRKTPDSLVVVNQTVTSFTQPVHQYILDQYIKIHTIGMYDIYENRY